MRRNLLLLTAAVALVGLAALFGVGRPEAARGEVATSDAVTTVGHGVVTLTPDRATVTAGVHTQAPTAAEALAQNAALMHDVIAALKRAGGDGLQTQQVSLYPQSDNDGKVTGYAADDSVSATSAIAKAGPLVDAAVAAGANTVGGPSLSVSDRDARYREALAKAVEDARAKAVALARAGGFGVGPVSSVTEETDTPQPVFDRTATAQKAAFDTPVEPGTQDIVADVSVTFRIR
jgi:uncharacterized protein YggE